MSPFPSTRVVHPRWAEHHAPVAVGKMNATCTITFGGTASTWTPEDGPVQGTPAVTYTGPCGVAYATTTQPANGETADQPVTTRAVVLSLPRGTARQSHGARVKVTAVDANGPSALVNRVLIVEASTYSSLGFEQDLTCTDDQANQPEA